MAHGVEPAGVSQRLRECTQREERERELQHETDPKRYTRTRRYGEAWNGRPFIGRAFSGWRGFGAIHIQSPDTVDTMTLLGFIATHAAALSLSGAFGAADTLMHHLAPATFRCSFPNGVSADMRGASVKTEVLSERFELVFDQIDGAKGTGRLIGNQGGGDVVVVASPEVTMILETVAAGAIQVTAIYSARRPDGAYKAVHSRHTAVFGGEPLPSQYYGSCRKLE